NSLHTFSWRNIFNFGAKKRLFMSVIVKDLTKIFGKQKAVDHISFTAKKGEILGFLGPNGAGKSTTMKIATGYMPPSSGAIEVCGHDVRNDTLEIRKKIG